MFDKYDFAMQNITRNAHNPIFCANMSQTIKKHCNDFKYCPLFTAKQHFEYLQVMSSSESSQTLQLFLSLYFVFRFCDEISKV